MPGHNSSLFVLGVMILWFGWYGFNPGSQLILAPGGSGAVANAALTTTLAPAVASLSALLTKASFHKFRTGRWSYDIMVRALCCASTAQIAQLVASLAALPVHRRVHAGRCRSFAHKSISLPSAL